MTRARARYRTPSASGGDGNKVRGVLSAQLEHLPRLRRARGATTEPADELDRAAHELTVGGELSSCEIEVVLEADSHIAPEQHRLRDHRELLAADTEGAPQRPGRQRVAHRHERAGIGRRAPGDAETQLKERRCLDQPAGDQVLREPDMSELEYLELRFHAEDADARRHLLE